MVDEAKSSRIGFSRILGLRESVALGFSVSVGLLVLTAAGVVLSMATERAMLAIALAAILYIPVILTYAEMAAGRPGSASPYQISRSYGSNPVTFLVGWLMLAGLLSAAALLSIEAAVRLDFAFKNFFKVDGDALWFLIAVIGLAALNEWLTSEDRWRSRTILVWGGLILLLIVVVWAMISHPPGELQLPTYRFRGHDLTKVALLAGALWFVDLLLNHRRQMRRPDRTLRVSLVGVWIGTCALGLIVVSLVLRSPSVVMENWPERISWGEARLEFLILATGTLFCWLGLSRIVSRAVRLTGAMGLHGYLPTVVGEKHKRVRALVELAVQGTIIAVVAKWAPESQILTVAAASFLLVTVLVAFPYARRPARELSPSRRNRLPLHPLFPGLTVATCLGLTLVLPRMGHGALLGWVLVGAAVYLGFGRRRSTAVKQVEVAVGQVEEVQRKELPRVLVAAGNMDQLPSLLKLGAVVARENEGEVVVVRVLASPDELSLHTVQSAADQEWRALDARVEAIDTGNTPVSTLVRIAPSIEAGILAASREYDVDLVLMGAPQLPRDAPPSAVLSGVFSSTSKNLAILRGQIPEKDLEVIVGTCGGPHASVALGLGDEIARGTGGQIELVSVVPKAQPVEEAAEAIRLTLGKAETVTKVSHRVVQSNTIESGLLESSRDKDLLIVGASIDRLLKRTVIDGLSLEISRVREGATLIVKRAEAAMRFWQRRLWEFLVRVTPTLTVPERSEIYSQMRHSAKANVDFYTLMSLSSAIAIFGLMLDSGAVIIGAMLVAPLMSPILAMAQGIVQGNPQMIQRAGASTFKGMSVSIAVSTLITAVLTQGLPTGEILARTSPNLLDLGVALAAGGAAAYAVSRASVASALPGVAISVALVPPLCVVGYGLGTSQFWISGGAFLLFLTNLAAIILVGALIFVLLGFRPTRVEREIHVRRAAAIAVVTVALLVVPLALTTVRVSREGRLQTEVNEAISDQPDRRFRVSDFSVTYRRRGFLVQGTVFAFTGFESERIFSFQEYLEEKVGVPVEVRLTIVPATLLEAGGENPAQLRSPVVPSDSE